MRSDPTPQEIERVINNLRLRKRGVREASGPHTIADCPSCGKQNHLYVNEATGNWDCKVCNQSGMLWSLATLLGMRLREKTVRQMTTLIPLFSRDKRVRDARWGGATITLNGIDRAHARLANPDDKHGQAVLTYLHARGFDEATITRFKLFPVAMHSKGEPSQLGVGIPYIEGGKVPLVKMRNLESHKDRRRFARTPGSHSGLFNVDGIRDCRQVVLVEGELDAISLWQMGVTNVASTSLGAKKDIPEEWVDALSGADDIVLFYDDDDSGDEAVAGLIQRLGVHRCRIARIPEKVAAHIEAKTGKAPKDANDLLTSGVSIDWLREWAPAIVEIAKEPANQFTLVPQSSFADVIAANIQKSDETLGLELPYDNLQALLRGVRLGEITLWTGHTGHGKTTFLSEFADLFCQLHMLPCAKFSLENGAATEARKAFQRLYGRPISSIQKDEDRECALETLSKMGAYPMYLADMHGEQLYDVVEAEIRYAVHRLNIRHFWIDHLHYFLNEDSRLDEQVFLSRVMKQLYKLAGDLMISINIAGHPYGKLGEDTVPTHETVKGTSTIKQCIDNSVTVYRYRHLVPNKLHKVTLKFPSGRRQDVDVKNTTAVVCVTKKRHDEANEGMIFFDFNARTLQFTPTTQEEMRASVSISNTKNTKQKLPPAVEAYAYVRDPFDDNN